MSIKTNPEIIENIEAGVHKFTNWLESYGWESYDQFDVWGTKLGVYAKKLFLRNKLLSAPLVLGLQSVESFLPALRSLFASKRRFAIGDAHFASGFLNLYKYYGDESYLETAKGLLDQLLTYASKSESGIGWGYPYIWVTQYGIFPRETPLITVTPYCFNAFLEAYKITGEKKYVETLRYIANFVAHDLHETDVSEKAVASSYSAVDRSQVVNAIAYRAAMLLKAYDFFGEDVYKEKAIKNVNFVLQSQKADGSFLYAEDSRFIDNFHTCFVLSKLYESYLVLQDSNILESVKKGYEFYRTNLFRADNTPIHFYKVRFPKFRKIEMYDYNEGISLGVLLANDIEGAFEFAQKMADDLINKFQLKQGSFVTRVSTLGTQNKVPYLRWPQAQLFCALTNVLIKSKSLEQDGHGVAPIIVEQAGELQEVAE